MEQELQEGIYLGSWSPTLRQKKPEKSEGWGTRHRGFFSS